MSSRRSREASRRNGALSKGPKTEAGKRRSSQNSLRHGLLAKRVVLDTDNEENFHIVLNQHVEKFQPADGVEFGMIEEMVSCYRRLHRAMAIENQIFNETIEKHDGSNMECLAAAWTDLADTPKLQNLLRYMSMLHRMHRRALNNLLLLRDIGPDETEIPNEPVPTSGHLENPENSAPEPPESTPEQPENAAEPSLPVHSSAEIRPVVRGSFPIAAPPDVETSSEVPLQRILADS